MQQIKMDTKDMVEFFNETDIGSFEGIAMFLGISPRTIYTWINKGSIPQRHHKRLQDVIDERKNLKIKHVLDKVAIGELIRAIEKRGYVVSIETRT